MAWLAAWWPLLAVGGLCCAGIVANVWLALEFRRTYRR